MKRIILIIIICLTFAGISKAQFGPMAPNFEFGIKGGANVSTYLQYGIYNNKDSFGYMGGMWARITTMGINIQPEVYVSGKNVRITDVNGNVNNVRFTSLDIPLYFGIKTQVFDIDTRLYTGPLVSIAISKDQDATNDVVRLRNYDDRNYSWKIGGGLDHEDLSVDLTYEVGINKLAYGPRQYSHTRLNLISLTLAYRLFWQ